MPFQVSICCNHILVIKDVIIGPSALAKYPLSIFRCSLFWLICHIVICLFLGCRFLSVPTEQEYIISLHDQGMN